MSNSATHDDPLLNLLAGVAPRAFKPRTVKKEELPNLGNPVAISEISAQGSPYPRVTDLTVEEVKKAIERIRKNPLSVQDIAEKYRKKISSQE